MRQYEPIWNALKKNHKASLTAPIELHRRIIQAVRKEKVSDLAWKFINSENNKKYELKEDITGRLITFRLVDISPITLNDL